MNRKTRDRDVRDAVLRKVLADHLADPRVLVVEELGLQHGSCRIDIAVVNGFLHGYELKSDSDTLERLPAQVEAYSYALDRATLVVGGNHLEAAEALLPSWWGIKVARNGKRGGVVIETHRAVGMNPCVSPYHLAHLLWRPEVAEILSARGVEGRQLRGNRRELYKLAADLIPLNELRLFVRESLKHRKGWRCPSLPL
ncbi:MULTISPECIES: sce7726 family protein [Ralstonia solanacearum species complex]|uniref:sce7726 family protein n=1 Tax=Ralstonia solanacearum species complex TaxID=3116862 RepID=UPI0009E4F2EC|nr:sce7726 family protein [Ralstonia pseudosolanacearum]MCK4123781.1 sce7726 family protein [Ralstonia pseudosolanacearum]